MDGWTNGRTARQEIIIRCRGLIYYLSYFVENAMPLAGTADKTAVIHSSWHPHRPVVQINGLSEMDKTSADVILLLVITLFIPVMCLETEKLCCNL